MKTFIITYLDNEGDLCHVHLEAFTKEDARVQVRQEYWNVNEIISIIDERN